MMWGMGLIWVLVVIVLVLAASALVKYLISKEQVTRRLEHLTMPRIAVSRSREGASAMPTTKRWFRRVFRLECFTKHGWWSEVVAILSGVTAHSIGLTVFGIGKL